MGRVIFTFYVPASAILCVPCVLRVKSLIFNVFTLRRNTLRYCALPPLFSILAPVIRPQNQPQPVTNMRTDLAGPWRIGRRFPRRRRLHVGRSQVIKRAGVTDS